MKLKLTVAAALMVLASNTAYSQTDAFTGNRMLRHCKGLATEDIRMGDATGRGVCLGTVNTLFVTRSAFNYCLPKEVNVGQAIRVAVRYMEANPQELHEELAILAMKAFVDVWPCKD